MKAVFLSPPQEDFKPDFCLFFLACQGQISGTLFVICIKKKKIGFFGSQDVPKFAFWRREKAA